MICQKCGAVIADGTLICPECGRTARSTSSGEAETAEPMGRGLSTYEIQLARKRAFSSPMVLIGTLAYTAAMFAYFCVAGLYSEMESEISYSTGSEILVESAVVFLLSMSIVIPGILMVIGLWEVFASFNSRAAEDVDLSGAKLFRKSYQLQKILAAVAAVITVIAIFVKRDSESSLPIIAVYLTFVAIMLIPVRSEINKVAKWALTGGEKEDPSKYAENELLAIALFGPLGAAAHITEKRFFTDGLLAMIAGSVMIFCGAIGTFLLYGLGLILLIPGIAYFCFGNVILSYKKALNAAHNSAPVFKKETPKPATGGYYSHDEAVAAELANSIFCKNCGAKNDLDSLFCMTCGQKLERPKPEIAFCPYCGSELEEESAFCSNCGKKL